jgi:hypothetical protein
VWEDGMSHSMNEALEIQKAFIAQYAHKNGVLGIGIGLNESRDDLALAVSVSRPGQAEKLPDTFRGLDVRVDVVGHFESLG